MLESFDRLARMEYGRRGRSKLIRTAILEYLDRHGQGNPQRPLNSSPSAERAEMKQLNSHGRIDRIEQGLKYLKKHSRLSIRQIAQVTYLNRSKIARIVKGIHVKPVLTKNFDAQPWRKRWDLFLSGVPAHQAFQWRGGTRG